MKGKASGLASRIIPSPDSIFLFLSFLIIIIAKSKSWFHIRRSHVVYSFIKTGKHPLRCYNGILFPEKSRRSGWISASRDFVNSFSSLSGSEIWRKVLRSTRNEIGEPSRVSRSAARTALKLVKKHQLSSQPIIVALLWMSCNVMSLHDSHNVGMGFLYA